MTTFEIESYINDHSNILTDFRNKYLDFLTNKNNARSTDKKWSSLRIEREADKAVANFVGQVQAKISAGLSKIQRKKPDAWVKCMENNGIIDELEESIIDLDFDD